MPLPLYIFKTAMHRGGIRLTKRPKLERPVSRFNQRSLPGIYTAALPPGNIQATKRDDFGRKSVMINGIWYPAAENSTSLVGASYVPPSRLEVPMAGNLPNNDYRFWLGRPAEHSILATCRACAAECYSKEHRKSHTDANSCTTKLIAAYKEFINDGVCVICDTKTVRSCWGVPLCSAKCINFWKFNVKEVLPKVAWAIKKAYKLPSNPDVCVCGHHKNAHGTVTEICLVGPCQCMAFLLSPTQNPVIYQDHDDDGD